jgi:hypothetical protein
MRNSLYTIWLTYITSAIREIDKRVLNVLRSKNQNLQIRQDIPLYIEETDSKKASHADVRILPSNDIMEYEFLKTDSSIYPMSRFNFSLINITLNLKIKYKRREN